ncbi:S41 family peptidase [Massilia oculi]|uniref:S41 family peptidase n=1 Tax=Massilia oculi TaxID=945844 RepID=UPI001AAE633E|nr:S41 family peptidase [Massilia oculi]
MTRTLSLKALAFGLCSLQATLALAAPPQNPWAAMARADADFIHEWIERQSISAVYPADGAFKAQLARARSAFDADSARVDSYAGYRHALGSFVGSLQDLHLTLRHSLTPSSYGWPGFMAVYRGGRYLVATQGSDLAGQEITQCDGQPMDALVRRVATYEQLIAGLESTKARAAPLVFRDAGSPFVPRPRSCRIGGRDIVLDWQPVAASRFAADMRSAIAYTDRVTGITPFGADGAWVRLGIFDMQTQAEGKAFKQLMADAPALRDKSVIVLDVRGNGGGPYEWFMGFLRALYGKDYADYHARSRLEISHVYRVTPEIMAFFGEHEAAETGELVPPADGTPFDKGNVKYRQAVEAGKTVLVTPPNARAIPKPAREPVNPVKARVLLLTDYNCASACIVFVDELKRFPGVEQVGVETSVDSRTGTGFGAPLPSKNGVIEVPVVTRDGRARGDNIPQRPSRIFSGNILDTTAVKAWIGEQILGGKMGAHPDRTGPPPSSAAAK